MSKKKEPTQKTNESAEPAEPGFAIQKIYLKDCSYEAPNTPGVFTEQVQPKFHIDIDIKHSVLDKEQSLYEVVLPVTVKADSDKGVVFLIEVHQAGVFQITGVEEDNISLVLEINCPDILLPYARQTVSSMVATGGFPQLLINPVNFEVLYQQRHGSDKS